MASLHFNAFVHPITRASRGRSSNFWGSWLGTVKRERREADRKLVAGCYLCHRGRNVNPDAGINPPQAAWGNCRSRRGVEWHRYRRFAVEELAAVRALETWMQIVDAPDAESDCRSCDILCTGMAVFCGTSNPQGCPVVCFSSGGASAASRSVLRSAAFSSFFLCFSSVRARAALCRSARSRR